MIEQTLEGSTETARGKTRQLQQPPSTLKKVERVLEKR